MALAQAKPSCMRAMRASASGAAEAGGRTSCTQPQSGTRSATRPAAAAEGEAPERCFAACGDSSTGGVYRAVARVDRVAPLEDDWREVIDAVANARSWPGTRDV